MKTLATLFLAASASSAMAGVANMYNCGSRGVSVQIATTSYTGKPQMVVGTPNDTNPPTAPHAINLNNVAIVRSAMGFEVSGIVPGLADATRTYTLIVPTVIVKDEEINDVKGMLVESFEATFFGPSGPGPGPRIGNKFTPVVCTATQAAS